jgi:hypothetical protein
MASKEAAAIGAHVLVRGSASRKPTVEQAVPRPNPIGT